MRILSGRYLSLFFGLMVFFSFNLISRADDEVTGEAITFTAGGRSHIIVYATDESDSPQSALVIEAIRETLPVYNRLWGVESPQIFIKVLVEPAASGAFADAIRIRDASVPIPGTSDFETRDVCLLNIYNDAETRDAAAVQLTTAHEIAHCYQAYYMTYVTGFWPGDEDDWWTEGSAEWLATHVYAESESTPTLSQYQEDFIVHHEAGLLEGSTSYDGMYFWAALEQQISTEGVMDFLKAMPDDPSGYVSHVMALPDVDTIFHNYGRFASEDLLPYQPPSADLFEAAPYATVETMPHVFDVFAYPFAFDFITLEVPTLAENQGVSLSVSGLSDLDMQMSLLGAEQITDAAPVELCPVTLPIRLIISRTANESEESAQFTVDVIECDEAPAAESTGLPECLIGTWHVTEFPQIPGITDVAIVSGNQVVTFAPDGLVVVTTEEFSIRMTSEIVIELTVDGSLVSFTIDSISEDGAISVTPVSSDLGVAFAIVNGTRVSINLNSVGGAVVAPAPLRFDCGADTLFWYFMANGAETRFELVRVE